MNRPKDIEAQPAFGYTGDGHGGHTEGTAAGSEVVTRIKDHQIVIALCEGDFESSMRREPPDQEEFDEYAWQKRARRLSKEPMPDR
jgi:hypothetical protein